jgi:hypothetical protein
MTTVTQRDRAPSFGEHRLGPRVNTRVTTGPPETGCQAARLIIDAP